MMWLKNVEGCGEGCVWVATIADKVVRDVDSNALAYFDDVTFVMTSKLSSGLMRKQALKNVGLN